MDTKTTRRNFYQVKAYLNHKHHQEYTTQRFSDDLQYLLDQFIPKATLKQLTKFMEKKFSRIVKLYPDVQKALKKTLKDKLNKMPQTLKKQQIQKILNFFKSIIPNIQFTQKEENQYHFSFKAQKQIKENEPYKVVQIENIDIRIPKDKLFLVDASQKSNPQKPFYRITCTDPDYGCVRYFASTIPLIEQKFIVNKGNFQRQANNFLDKLVEFSKLTEMIESQEV